MAEEKRSFVLYCAYREQLALLTDEERGRLLMALFDYCESKTVPELQGMPLMAFAFIKAQIDRDSEKYDKTVQARREAGRKGGKATKKAEKQTQAKQAFALLDNQTEAPQSESTADFPPAEKPDAEIAPKKDVHAERFIEFWSVYPKKVGKGAAEKAWSKIKPNAELHLKILSAIERQKMSEQWLRDNGQYIPNPATWLNQRRWEDELQEANPARGGYRYGNEQHTRNAQPNGFTPSGGFRGSDV